MSSLKWRRPCGLIPAHAGKTCRLARKRREDPAHPRSRGENDPGGRRQVGAGGSSPLTRGKPSQRFSLLRERRLIPAHAGKTFGCSCLNSSYAAHPRSRGENGKKSFKKLPAIGSSPLTRGKPLHRVDEAGDYRLIPAHAGKTGDRFNLSGVGEAHPRSRGENASRDAHSSEPTGSSPLTRGKRERRRDPIAGARLIPAHAGKTVSCLRGCRPQRAHPRSRGENDPGGLRPRGIGGSSPLTRGKHFVDGNGSIRARLIPAHAGKTRKVLPGTTGTMAHPRSRGENRALSVLSRPTCGSSPLTRGKRPCCRRRFPHKRLIPAHAGKTRPAQARTMVRSAHPRSRGENLRRPSGSLAASGSSPLTRGKPAQILQIEIAARLIPAHAGKTGLAAAVDRLRAAHPRSRGENQSTRRPALLQRGSSPLTRGKHQDLGYRCDGLRLIPAHAGKTDSRSLAIFDTPAHPRSRGENRVLKPGGYMLAGSSPLTRGKPVVTHADGHTTGLIPAHAGKTATPSAASAATTAHPRSRGENFQRCLTACQMLGSSPLTRGKPREVLKIEVAARLIPAHAGKTTGASGHGGSRTAHPRSRGENASASLSPRRVGGSSPLTRGKLLQGGCEAGSDRLIPAHAGKTGDGDGHGRCTRAHPRSRGENAGLGELSLRGGGSSPLTRRKPDDVDGFHVGPGLIPAHAGKTEAQYVEAFCDAAHPRSRGENRIVFVDGGRPAGSSPLTRGKQLVRTQGAD